MNKKKLIEIIEGCVINSQVLTEERVCFNELRKELNEEIPEQLILSGVSNCNAKKDTNIENTILLISRKDGLTDVYDNSGCLGKGLDTQGINDLNIT